MGLLEILLLGVALATDAFSVTISNTFAFDDHRVSRLMRMPLFFGLFQFGMPLAGYFVGGIAAELIEKYAGMVSLVILGFIGSNMLYSGYKALKEDASEEDEEEAQQGATRRSLWNGRNRKINVCFSISRSCLYRHGRVNKSAERRPLSRSDNMGNVIGRS